MCPPLFPERTKSRSASSYSSMKRSRVWSRFSFQRAFPEARGGGAARSLALCRDRDARWEFRRSRECRACAPRGAIAGNRPTNCGTDRSVRSPAAATRSSRDTSFSRRNNSQVDRHERVRERVKPRPALDQAGHIPEEQRRCSASARCHDVPPFHSNKPGGAGVQPKAAGSARRAHPQVRERTRGPANERMDVRCAGR